MFYPERTPSGGDGKSFAMHPLGKVALLGFGTLFACSSSSSPHPVAAGDASAPGDGNDGGLGAEAAVADLPTCGAPPYVTLGIVVRAASAGGEGAVVAGAKLTTSLCPGTLRLSGDDGVIRGRVSKGVPFFARFEAKSFAPTLISEQTFDADKDPIVAPLAPSFFTALVPGYDATKAAIVVGVIKDGGSGPCDALDGVSLQVEGYPEAKVTYFTADAIPAATSGTTTTVAGRAAITGLPDVPFVTLKGSKAGCAVTFLKAPYTGRAPLEAGFLTLAPAYLH